MMKITKLGENIGAEVTGIDLKQELDAETRDRLNHALTEHIALVVRDQAFEPEDYLRAVSIFGAPMQQHFTQYQLKGTPLVNYVSNRDAYRGGTNPVVRGAGWHTDHTNHECPPKCTSLYAMVLPDEGGDTGIVNMRAGYAALPDDIKARINGMRTLNVIEGSASPRPTSKLPTENQGKVDKGMLQPLVRSHPDCGDDALYFHPIKTEHIVGMSPEESQALLNELLDLTVKDEFIYRHKWRLGDMLIWDNRCSLHQAYQDYDLSQERLLHRVILKGERPFGPAMPLAS
ncbi:MAG: TauD/TfdA family dioxygenase [Proteobacteria bacterium]|nr:TauD/TfdA family dioxygenase [Pseudomonadota bacterium]